ncbi:MAG TPA: hypothetical protein VI754_09195 [Bacteriovoracaceae bacterium]|nr:hypothetical protein [Bacteriovoracaceae bacterium]
MAIFLTIFIALSSQMSKLQTHITTKNLIERDSIGHKRLVDLEKDFYVRNSLFLLLQGDVDQSTVVCLVNTWIQNESFYNSEIESVYSPFLFRTVESTEKTLRYPYLLKLSCDGHDEKVDYSAVNKTPWFNSYVPVEGDVNNIGYEILFRKTPGGSKYGEVDPKKIGDFKMAWEDFRDKNLPQMKSYFLGSMGMLYFSFEGIGNTGRLNLIFLIAIVFLFRIFWGTFRSGIIFVLSLVFMGGILFGTMGLTHTPVDILNTGIFLMVAVSSLEDFVFISAEKIKTNEQSDVIFRRTILPCFFTSLTTIIGFGSLYFTDLTIIRRFGIFAAYGSLLEWVMTFFLLPSLVTMFPFFENWTDSKRGIFSKYMDRFIKLNFPRYLLIPALFLFFTGGYALLFPVINDAPFDIYTKDHNFKVGIDELKKSRGWEANFDIVFRDYKDRKFNVSVLDVIRQDDSVELIQDPYSLDEYYTSGLGQLRKDLVRREYEGSKEYERFVSKDGKARAIVYIRKNQLSTIDPLIAKIASLCEGEERCFSTGEVVAYSEFSKNVPKVLIESFGISIICVIIIIWLLAQLKRTKNIFALIITSIWGPFAILSVIGMTHTPVNFVTCIFAGVIIGLTGDNAIQYIFSSENGLAEGIQYRATGSIQIFLIMALSSLIFQFAYFQFSKDLGIFLVAGMFLSLVGDLWMLKALINWNYQGRK